MDRFEAGQQKVRQCNNAKVEAHIGGLEAPRKILRQIKRLLLLATQPTSAKENDETQDTRNKTQVNVVCGQHLFVIVFVVCCLNFDKD